MRESLLTIPINEVFEPREGCPICRMRDTVEEHICEYIMGAAMMEPDVRMETNRLGFCNCHFGMLLKQNNRLSLGLMLNSYLAEHRKAIFERRNIFTPKGAKAKKASELTHTCFVCTKVDWGISHMFKTLFVMFQREKEFRALFSSQEYVCMPHYDLLLSTAPAHLAKGDLAEFLKALDGLVGGYMKELNADIDTFCNSFDYRNAGSLHKPEMEHVRTSVARSIKFLTGRPANTD